MYTLGQLLPVGMVIGGCILILLSEGVGTKSGFATAGAILIGFAYLGIVRASEKPGKPERRVVSACLAEFILPGFRRLL